MAKFVASNTDASAVKIFSKFQKIFELPNLFNKFAILKLRVNEIKQLFKT